MTADEGRWWKENVIYIRHQLKPWCSAQQSSFTPVYAVAAAAWAKQLAAVKPTDTTSDLSLFDGSPAHGLTARRAVGWSEKRRKERPKIIRRWSN